jgi:hypothetical protein
MGLAAVLVAPVLLLRHHDESGLNALLEYSDSDPENNAEARPSNPGALIELDPIGTAGFEPATP